MKEGDTLAEKSDVQAQQSWCCAARGWGERSLKLRLSCQGLSGAALEAQAPVA